MAWTDYFRLNGPPAPSQEPPEPKPRSHLWDRDDGKGSQHHRQALFDIHSGKNNEVHEEGRKSGLEWARDDVTLRVKFNVDEHGNARPA